MRQFGAPVIPKSRSPDLYYLSVFIWTLKRLGTIDLRISGIRKGHRAIKYLLNNLG